MKTNEPPRAPDGNKPIVKPAGCPYTSYLGCVDCDGILLIQDEERGEVARPCPVFLENRQKTSVDNWLLYLERHHPRMREMLDTKRQIEIPFELEPDEERRLGAERILADLSARLKKHIEDWLGPKPHKGAVLVGPPGSGKTKIAIQLARRYVEITETWVEVSVEREALMNFSDSFQDASANRRRYRLWHCPALYLDDIGTKLNYTGPQLDEENNVLMHHYDKGHLLILTTNKPLMDEEDEYGNIIEKGLVGDGVLDDRLASRLMSCCKFYSTQGIPDWRMLQTNL